MCLKLFLSDDKFSVDEVSAPKLGGIFSFNWRHFFNPYILNHLAILAENFNFNEKKKNLKYSP